MNATLEHSNSKNYSHTWFPNESTYSAELSENTSSRNTSGYEMGKKNYKTVQNAVGLSILVISIFGALGNGAVIWLLGFRIKRNPFSTYILNLAVADLGLLLSIIVNMTSSIFFITELYITMYITQVFSYLILLTYSASQFFVTAISIDRCAAVFFPLWYQCKRPPHLTTIVSALIWVLSVLLTAISCTVYILNPYKTEIEISIQFIANAVLCLPVMTIATACLVFKFCFKTQQHRRGRLLTIVLLTLVFFLFFGFPHNVIYILYVLKYLSIYALIASGLLACLNSSVNPVIYFLVARQRKSRHGESMKTMLQKVFKEEETCTEDTTAETRV